ncbi:outer membrane protein assembly factor BamB family protein [Streptomyces sp. 6N223]|uniref:outer membrane protein assembly factor BamB family protein n=1 Tax=Streptomyces sp. 6N223 TaxID=3457412 RepID=UPI003FD538D2
MPSACDPGARAQLTWLPPGGVARGISRRSRTIKADQKVRGIVHITSHTPYNARSGRLAAALLVAGGMLLTAACGDSGEDASGEDGAAADELAATWRTQPVTADDEALPQPRLWATDRAVVSVTSSGVRGYDPATGEDRWELPPPEGADAPCGAAPDVNAQGIGAVLYRPVNAASPDTCSVLGVVDTASGELLWSHDLTTPDPEYAAPGSSYTPVTVGEETVTAELVEDGLHRFAVADGAELPVPEVPAQQVCEDFYTDWRHSAEHLVAVTSCDEMTEAESEITAFDAASGEELWTAPDATGADDDIAEIVAGAPLTVTTQERLVSFGEDGQVAADLPLDRQDGYLAVEPGNFAVQGSTLVTTFDDSAQEFVGIDLTTGEEAWQKSPDGPAEGFVGGDDHVLSAYSAVADGTGGAPTHIARLNAADGTWTVEGVLPEDAGFTWTMAADDATVYVLAEPDSGGDGTLRIEAYERP